MRKLIAGSYSQRDSFHIYDCGDGRLENMEQKPLHDCDLRDLIKEIKFHTEVMNSDTHFLIRRSKDEWFCEYVVRYGPGTEIFIVGYGKSPQEAFDNVLKML